MPIHLHIEAANAGDLLAQLTALTQNLTGAPDEQTVETVKSETKRAPRGSTAKEATAMKAADPTSANTAGETASSPKETASTSPASASQAATEGNESAEIADTAGSTSEASAPAAAADALTYADIRAVMLKLTTAKGRDAAIELLGKHNVAKAQDLSEDQYADFIADAKAAAEA